MRTNKHIDFVVCQFSDSASSRIFPTNQSIHPTFPWRNLAGHVLQDSQNLPVDWRPWYHYSHFLKSKHKQPYDLEDSIHLNSFPHKTPTGRFQVHQENPRIQEVYICVFLFFDFSNQLLQNKNFQYWFQELPIMGPPSRKLPILFPYL